MSADKALDICHREDTKGITSPGIRERGDPNPGAENNKIAKVSQAALLPTTPVRGAIIGTHPKKTD